MMRFTVFSLAFLYSLQLSAQWTFSGDIKNKDGQALEGVEIYHFQSGRQFYTDQQGQFAIDNINTDTNRFVFFNYQYETLDTAFYFNGNRQLSILLNPLSDKLSEVTIEDKRKENFRLKRLREVEGTAIYAGKKTEVVLIENTVGNLGANNARQIYAQVSGLNIYENDDAGLQLNIGGRGLDPNRTSNFNVRQNGYDISADVLGYPESYYTPPAEALEEIQIVRGAASLQYGTQFGGLLNFKIKEPVKDKAFELITRNTLGSYGLLTNFTSASGKLGKFSYYTYFNYKEGDGWRPNSAYHSRNFYAHLKYDFTTQTNLGLEYTLLNYLAKQPGGLTDSQFNTNPEFSNRNRNWFQVKWQLFNLRFNHNLSPKTTISLNAFALNAERNAVGFRGNPSSLNINPILEIDEVDLSGNYLNPRDLIKGTFVNGGLEARLLHRYKLIDKRSVFLVGGKYYHSRNTNQQGPGTTTVNPDFNFAYTQFPSYANQSDFVFPNLNLAVFAENIFRISDKFSITPGLRFEYIKTASEGQYQVVNFDNAGNPIFRDTLGDNRNFERAFVLFGLGASYKPSKVVELYANFSQNYRSVTFNDIRTVNPTFIIDPDISDESGFTADAGLRGEIKTYLNYDVSAFGLLYDNRIGTILNNRAQRVRKNIGTAFIYGVETMVELDWINLMGRTKSSFHLSNFVNMALTTSSYLSSEENNVTGKEVEFIPLVNLKTNLRVGYKNLLVNFQLTYISEQFTDVENSGVATSGDLREGIIGPIPSYYIADLSMSYKYKFAKLETGINNLIDERYFTRRATGYPGPGIIPSAPRTFYVTLELQLDSKLKKSN